MARYIRLFIAILALLTTLLDVDEAGSAGLATHLGEKEARSFANGAGTAMVQSSPFTSTSRINSKLISEDIVPDGDLHKRVWETAEWAEFDHAMSGAPSYPQAVTKVAALWTAHYVYFGFRCHYTSLNIYQGEDPAKKRWELWNRDVAEVFLNPQPERVSHYYEFEVAPNNQWIDLEIDKTKTPFNDAGWDSHFEHATRIDAGNHVWTCEMRIPVKSMGVEAVRAGDEWRLNFFRADGPGGDSERRFMSWSTIPEGTSFHVPARFGIIHFAR
ncbi:MAG: carbohydrate-binding family 9-like protein [Terriglobia bacterium]